MAGRATFVIWASSVTTANPSIAAVNAARLAPRSVLASRDHVGLASEELVSVVSAAVSLAVRGLNVAGRKSPNTSKDRSAFGVCAIFDSARGQGNLRITATSALPTSPMQRVRFDARESLLFRVLAVPPRLRAAEVPSKMWTIAARCAGS